jgi:hypothetical protein
MSDAAAVLRATAEAAQMARQCNCVIDVKVGKSRGQGEVHVKIEPIGPAEVVMEDAPTVLIPPSEQVPDADDLAQANGASGQPASSDDEADQAAEA